MLHLAPQESDIWKDAKAKWKVVFKTFLKNRQMNGLIALTMLISTGNNTTEMLHQDQWALRHHGQWLRSTHVEDLEPGDVEYTDEESLGSLGGQSLVDTLYEPGEETVVDGLGQSTDWVDYLQTKRFRIKRLQLLFCLLQKTKLFFPLTVKVTIYIAWIEVKFTSISFLLSLQKHYGNHRGRYSAYFRK